MLRRLPLATLWLLLVLLIPTVAWVFGVRQPLIENRAKAELPEINRGTLKQEETFRQIDTFLLDRLPLRKEAVELNARVNVRLFQDSPSPQVAIGDDGWLYFVPELELCREAALTVDPADAAEIVAGSLVASGRRAVVTVVGSKFSIHPQHAPDLDPQAQACQSAMERRVAQRLEAAPGGLDTDDELLDLERRGEATFLVKDTHWNEVGRLSYTRQVLEAIRRGLSREAGLGLGQEIDRPGDLSALMGMSETDADRVVVARRTPRRPPTGVALLGDSQMRFALLEPPTDGVPPVMQRALPGATFCDVGTVADGACDAVIAEAETVVVETVGRNLGSFTASCWRPVTIAARDFGLRGRAAAFARVDGSAAQDRAGLDLDAQTGARVRIVPPGPDRLDVPRLVTIPVEAGVVTMTQAPENGPAAPCATPGADASGAVLVLPIPAGRSASELIVDLTATAPARLGRPRVTELRGDAPGG